MGVVHSRGGNSKHHLFHFALERLRSGRVAVKDSRERCPSSCFNQHHFDHCRANPPIHTPSTTLSCLPWLQDKLNIGSVKAGSKLGQNLLKTHTCHFWSIFDPTWTLSGPGHILVMGGFNCVKTGWKWINLSPYDARPGCRANCAFGVSKRAQPGCQNFLSMHVSMHDASQVFQNHVWTKSFWTRFRNLDSFWGPRWCIRDPNPL